MNPTALQKKMASKMTDFQLSAALETTQAAIVAGGGSLTAQGTRWQNLSALKAEAARRKT